MKYMSTIRVRTSTVKTLNFRTAHLHKKYKVRSACSLGICLIRVYTVAIPSAHLLHCCKNRTNRPLIVGQGPAVLVAGTGWKQFDFSLLFNFNKILPGKEMFSENITNNRNRHLFPST